MVDIDSAGEGAVCTVATTLHNCSCLNVLDTLLTVPSLLLPAITAAAPWVPPAA